jgi:asparagine synthase (glutamine-hydrolysing)
MRFSDLRAELLGARAVSGLSVSSLLKPVVMKAAKAVVPRSLRGSLVSTSAYLGPAFGGKRTEHPEALTKSDFNLQRRLWEEETRFNMQQLLHYEDRNSMAFSIEARVPFIEYRLIEYAMHVPAVYKIHNGWSKYLLRTAMEGMLPAEIQWRKDKMGFVTPEETWIRELRSAFTARLRQESLRSGRFIRGEKFLAEFERGSIALGSSDVWRFINLEFWMREFNVS